MYPKVKSIQFQMDNIVAPSYLVKIGGGGGGYTKQNLNYLEQENMGVFIGQGTSQEIWTFLYHECLTR